MRTLAATISLLSLASGLLLADKATDERLANAAKAFEEGVSVCIWCDTPSDTTRVPSAM